MFIDGFSSYRTHLKAEIYLVLRNIVNEVSNFIAHLRFVQNSVCVFATGDLFWEFGIVGIVQKGKDVFCLWIF